MYRRLTHIVPALAAVVIAGCGSRVDSQSGRDTSATAATTAPTAAPTAQTVTQTPESSSLPTTTPADSGAAQSTTLGPITFVLPGSAVDYPGNGPAPDFVIARRTWLIGEEGSLGIGVQAQLPLLQPDTLTETFDSNGLHWKIYESGKLPGTGLTAVTNVGTSTAVIVAGDAFIPSTDEANEAIRAAVVATARSLTFNGVSK